MADAVSAINNVDKEKLYQRLLAVAKRRTAEADVELDDRGRPMEEDLDEFGANVLIVPPGEPGTPAATSRDVPSS